MYLIKTSSVSPLVLGARVRPIQQRAPCRPLLSQRRFRLLDQWLKAVDRDQKAHPMFCIAVALNRQNFRGTLAEHDSTGRPDLPV